VSKSAKIDRGDLARLSDNHIGPADSGSASDAADDFLASSGDAGRRLDQFLVTKLTHVSRARVQELITQEKIHVNGKPGKPSLKLRGGERIKVLGPAERPPLRAMPENIPLAIVYEDGDLVVIDKPAGMMVHAGAGPTDAARNRGTLVNALLHRFGGLSSVGGDIRPGIVHRLDRNTSGLIVVAKHDDAHRKLAAQWAARRVKKTYLALIHGWPGGAGGVIDAPISRDVERRNRMTTRRSAGRQALSRYEVRDRFEGSYGKFALLAVTIETGRTHQIRVHLSSIGHPIVGDTLYGAPRQIVPARAAPPPLPLPLALPRNFLHAAAIEFEQPLTGRKLSFESALPSDLLDFLSSLRVGAAIPAKTGVKRL
jgi:23S rRNA pseudouridine1911/1915/1917 synthase